MTKLDMALDHSQRRVDDEIKIAEPFAFLVGIIGDEIGRNISSAERWLQHAKSALSGNQVSTGYGNAWKLEANAGMATFTNAYFPPDERYRIPTPLLVEALERWHLSLEARGFKPDKLDPTR